MRDSMEELLYGAGADLVLSGHVHAYERMHPTCASTPLEQSGFGHGFSARRDDVCSDDVCAGRTKT